MRSAPPSTPAQIVDPTIDRDGLILTAEERRAISGRPLRGGDLLMVALVVFGMAGTAGVIKVTTGIPIDTVAELAHVRATALTAHLAERDLGDQDVACVSLRDFVDPAGSWLADLEPVAPLLLAYSECRDVEPLFGRKETVVLQHVDWLFGGRAIAVLNGSSGRVRYWLQRRSDGWHVVAVRPS